jgi:argininosuccinate lyase
LTLSDATPELLQKVAEVSAGLILKVKAEDIQASIDPAKFVESHKVKGGPSPTEVKRMIKNRKQLIVKSKVALKEKEGKLDAADSQLKSVVDGYLKRVRLKRHGKKL